MFNDIHKTKPAGQIGYISYVNALEMELIAF